MYRVCPTCARLKKNKIFLRIQNNTHDGFDRGLAWVVVEENGDIMGQKVIRKNSNEIFPVTDSGLDPTICQQRALMFWLSLSLQQPFPTLGLFLESKDLCRKSHWTERLIAPPCLV